jgi:hypothetical protein
VLTGELELALKHIQHGTREFDDVRTSYTEIVKEVVGLVKGFDYDALYDTEEPIGSCPNPVCKGHVIENLRGYSCQFNTAKDSDCNFMLWKELWGRYIERLLAN